MGLAKLTSANMKDMSEKAMSQELEEVGIPAGVKRTGGGG